MPLATTELATGDGSGDGYIQTVGSVALMKIWNQQLTTNPGANSVRNTIALIAHHNKASRGKGLCIDVLAIKEGAIYRIVGW